MPALTGQNGIRKMVAQTNLAAMQRFFGLTASVVDLVVRGARNPAHVSDLLQQVKEHENFATRLGLEPVISDPEAEAVKFTVEDWLRFYRDDCGISISESDIVIPAPPTFPHWLVAEPAALTPNQGYAAMERRFGGNQCWRHTGNLDVYERIHSFIGVRAFYVRARIEADEELKDQSAQMIWDAKTPTLSLHVREA
ncbi:MAG: hypothetical protein AAB518_04040, partial [Patescibacteria group bacterium]